MKQTKFKQAEIGMIPEQMKKIWFWIYLISLLGSPYILKTALNMPSKIIILFVLIVVNVFFNIKIKWDRGITIFNWIITANLLLLFFAFLFTSFNNYDGAAIFLMLLIGGVLIAMIIHSLTRLWKTKDSVHENLVQKLILVISHYLPFAFVLILFASFGLSIAQLFPGNQIVDIVNNTNLSDFQDLSYYSAGVFYSSSFGDMVPAGASRWISISIAIVSYSVHVILLGVIISSLGSDSSKKK